MLTMSIPGTIVGTAAYMAAEQAKGRDVERTADIRAFGCVLFDAPAGRPVFDGGTAAEILAGVLKGEPDWSRLPAETPAGIRRLLRRCLAKDPRRVLQHAGDERIEIDEASSTGELVSTPRGGSRLGFDLAAVPGIGGRHI